jgi:hypothetical protein
MSDKKTAVLARLAETRKAVLEAFDGIDGEAWKTAVYTAEDNPDANWNISDIARHMISAEKGMTGLMMKIQSTGEGVPEDFDRERYNQRQVQKTQDKAPAELINEMQANRKALLAFIETLKEDDWDKNGRHASLKIMTIEEICYTIANHEADHLKGIQEQL